MEPSPDEKAKLLALRANVARSRLSATLSALDRRRREVFDIQRQVKEHLGGFLRVGAVVCITAVVAVAVYRAATAPRRRRVERWRLLGRVWRHPELAAKPQETFLGKLARTLLVGAARFFVTRLLSESGNAAELNREEPRLVLTDGLPGAAVER